MRKSWLLRSLLFCTVIFLMAACCQENSDCPPDSFCIKAPGDCEGEGVCIEKKSVPCDVVTEPVCGCDGKIYDNVCEAAEAGVSVTNEGECVDDLIDVNEFKCDAIGEEIRIRLYNKGLISDWTLDSFEVEVSDEVKSGIFKAYNISDDWSSMNYIVNDEA